MRRPLRETLRDIDKTPPKCLVKNSKLDESACKPDSVTPCGAGDHPSATSVSGGLPRTLPRPACDLPGSSGGPPSTPWGAPEVPAPPMLILFGAAAATLGARRRFAKSKAKADTKADKAA